jgi:hypothetical protein
VVDDYGTLVPVAYPPLSPHLDRIDP